MSAIPQALIGSSQQPGTNPLSIGSVTFNSSEAPTQLPIGAEQITTAQTLIGGARVVQTFGLSPEEVTWSGRLFGSFISARVSQLRLYVASGNPVKLSWVKSAYNISTGSSVSKLKEQYTVVVKRFTPTFYAQYAEYTITLVVVKANNGAYTAVAPRSIDTQISALQAQAVSLTNALIVNDPVQSASVIQNMTTVNAAINAAIPVSQNPLAGKSIQTTIQAAQAAITTYQALQMSGSSMLPVAIQLSGMLSAISRNIAAGYSPTAVQQQGGNAFTVASQYYGDPSQAYTLAQIAGLPSPFLPSGLFTTLQIPNIAPNPVTNLSTIT